MTEKQREIEIELNRLRRWTRRHDLKRFEVSTLVTREALILLLSEFDAPRLIGLNVAPPPVEPQ